MTARALTISLMISVFIVLITWDIYVVAFNNERNDSISNILRDWSKRVLLLPYSFGVLSGHLFLPDIGYSIYGWRGIALLTSSAISISGLGWLIRYYRFESKAYPWVMLIAGVLAGHLLWPQ